jgi:sulfur-oxidizing protein SoxB
MNLSRREFLNVMASASVAGMALGRYADADAATAEQGCTTCRASATSRCCT